MNLLKILRDYTPELICCNILPFSQVNNLNYKDLSNLKFSPYLAGLIERDKTIVEPKTYRKAKGKTNYTSIQIVFHLKYLPLALLNQRELKLDHFLEKKELMLIF